MQNASRCIGGLPPTPGLVCARLRRLCAISKVGFQTLSDYPKGSVFICTSEFTCTDCKGPSHLEPLPRPLRPFFARGCFGPSDWHLLAPCVSARHFEFLAQLCLLSFSVHSPVWNRQQSSMPCRVWVKLPSSPTRCSLMSGPLALLVGLEGCDGCGVCAGIDLVDVVTISLGLVRASSSTRAFRLVVLAR